MNRRDKLLRQTHYEEFLITLKNGKAFSGLLADVDDHVLKLVGAHAHSPDESVPMDGDLYLHRADIDYMQNAGGKP